jgi:hypothetical protein
MNPTQEAALRSLLVAIVMGILVWLTNSANIAPIIGVSGSVIVAALAGALDKYLSPDGTALAGSIGKRV